MLYDCHTYRPSLQPNVCAIVNLTENEKRVKNKVYSIGIHPWNVQDVTAIGKRWNLVFAAATAPEIIAIGECGLDKLCGNDIGLQMAVFEKHIALANTLQKPLIVHCVKAFPQTEEMLRQANVPVIIHGVNNKIEKVTSFLDNGYFLSFGKSLLTGNSIARKTLLQVPLSSVLLETDDGAVSIAEIYKTAGALLGIDQESLILQIQKNFKRIFSL